MSCKEDRRCNEQIDRSIIIYLTHPSLQFLKGLADSFAGGFTCAVFMRTQTYSVNSTIQWFVFWLNVAFFYEPLDVQTTACEHQPITMYNNIYIYTVSMLLIYFGIGAIAIALSSCMVCLSLLDVLYVLVYIPSCFICMSVKWDTNGSFL